MKKSLFIICLVFVFGCSEKKNEQNVVSFYDEAKLSLEKAINLHEGGIRLQELDTIFTAKSQF